MSRARRRYYRSVIISVLALAALLWVAVDQFGISAGEIKQLLLTSLLVLLLVVAAAAAAAALWMLLRKLFGRR
jgi:preprotein translocase subunit SecE